VLTLHIFYMYCDALFAMLFLYHMPLIQPVRDILYLNDRRQAMGH
jgi:hypothetical protein